MRVAPLAWITIIVLAGQSFGDLSDLAVVRDRTTQRASSHDATGGNEDSLVSFAPGETKLLLDAAGPGQITHIWMTLARFPGHEFVARDVVLRMYWEHAAVPSVEVPLGDFFGLGHGKLYTYQSLPIAVGANPVAMNCYWPMPFYKHARIELFNAGDRSIRRLYYNIDYELGEIPPGQGLFHALYKRDRTLPGQSSEGNTSGEDNYIILDTQGRGQYVGCTLSVDAQPGGWWGEGDEMIFIDGAAAPTIIGTGSEDYFCNAWGYKEPFSYPFYGAPLLEDLDDGRKLATVYRWHVPDPVRFRTAIKVTIEHLWSRSVINDYTSVAYWYQTEPMKQRPPLPPADENQPGPVVFQVDATALEPDCLARGIKARSITANLDEGYAAGGWLRIEKGGEPVRLRIPVPSPGSYSVQVRPVNHLVDTPLEMTLEGENPRIFTRLSTPTGAVAGQAGVPYVDLGEAVCSIDGLNLTIASGSPLLGIDSFRIRRTGSAGAR